MALSDSLELSTEINAALNQAKAAAADNRFRLSQDMGSLPAVAGVCMTYVYAPMSGV